MAFDLTSLVSHWSLNESSGTRSDSHGSNNLTDDSSVGFAAGKIGNCAVFSAASTDSLSRADNTDLRLSGTDATVTLWVNLSSKSGIFALCGKYDGGDFMEYMPAYRNSDDRFLFYVGNGSMFVAAVANAFGSPSVGVWYFLQCRINNTTKEASIRVNDGAWNSVTFTGNIKNGTATFHIGRCVPGLYANASIDEVSIWKRQVSDAELNAIYNAGNGIAYPFASGVSPQRRSAQSSIRSTF